MSVAGVIGAASTRCAQLLAGGLLAAVLLLSGSASALASAAWRVASLSNTTVQPGGQLNYHVELANAGDQSTDGSTVTLTVTLPDGMTGVSADTSSFASFGGFDCPMVSGATGTFTCTGAPSFLPHAYATLTITVDVGADVSGVRTTTFAVEGGGATAAATADPVTVTAQVPAFGIDAFDMAVTKGGAPFTQAGGHPDEVTTSIDVNTHSEPSKLAPDVWPVEDMKDVTVELPPGLVGDPTGLPQCTQAELANGEFQPAPLCPPSSQVGTALVRHSAGVVGPVPVYNMAPPPGVPARFAFNVVGSIVVLDAHVRTGGDYGLGVTASNVPQGLVIVGNTVTLWGVPADASHDGERGCMGQPSPYLGGPTCPSGGDRTAFFRNPTSCSPPGDPATMATVRMDSWQHQGDFVSATAPLHEPPGYPFASVDWGAPLGIGGCENVPFDPVLVAQPVAGAKAGAPSGFAVDVTVPQTDDPDVTASQSDVRKVTVTLPQGVRVNPSSADGLGACAPDQIALSSSSDATCPDSSKIGTVSIDTPLLDVPVTGNVYLAKPFDNPFNALVAVYIAASAKGVVIKLPGLAVMDPDSGQISTTFDNTPQLPFSRLHVELNSGPRAPLAMPNSCGTFTTHAELTGWNGRTVSSDSSFTLSENARGQPCPSTFTPGFRAGTVSNVAGSNSPFSMRFTRDDEDQELGSLSVHMAPGLTARIAKVDLCSDAQARANACPAASLIGKATVGAGAGSNPFFIESGKAYMTGPYKGAPFGASIVVPAVAGPFDLGLVTVRAAVFVDKHDATVRIVSDRLPTILKGIPLDVRDVRVRIDKPGFWLNPTNCRDGAIAATLRSTAGATADVSDRFQAVECRNLGFKPRMTLRVGGRGHTRRGQASGLTTKLRMPQHHQANLRFVRVTLPGTINARLNTINDACTRAEFENEIAKCAHAKAGSAVAVTPLLRGRLRGSVYFVKNGHPIPDLFVALRGQVAFDLIGRITIVNNRQLRTTFAATPDVPVRSFTLRLLGGSSSASIGAAANLCSARSRRAKAQVDYIGQNGKVRQVDQALKIGGCGSSRRNHRRH